MHTPAVDRFSTEGTPGRCSTGRVELDPASGLYYNRARWYDPSLGRFISEDPIGISGGINVYAYVWNDPVNYTDPWGLSPCEERDYNCDDPLGLAGVTVVGTPSNYNPWDGVQDSDGPRSISGGGAESARNDDGSPPPLDSDPCLNGGWDSDARKRQRITQNTARAWLLRHQCQARFSDMRSALVLDAIMIGAGVATGGGSALLAVGARASPPV